MVHVELSATLDLSSLGRLVSGKWLLDFWKALIFFSFFSRLFHILPSFLELPT